MRKYFRTLFLSLVIAIAIDVAVAIWFLNRAPNLPGPSSVPPSTGGNYGALPAIDNQNHKDVSRVLTLDQHQSSAQLRRVNATTESLDDYPYKAPPTCASSTSGCQNEIDPYGFYYHQSTSFIAWRINRDAGTINPGAPSFTNKMNGGRWSNAENWSSNAEKLGYRVDNIPEVGAIAHWKADECNGCTAGHVAYVESVNPDGSVNISEYRSQVDRGYSFRPNVKDVGRFIHIPMAVEESKSAAAVPEEPVSTARLQPRAQPGRADAVADFKEPQPASDPVESNKSAMRLNMSGGAAISLRTAGNASTPRAGHTKLQVARGSATPKGFALVAYRHNGVLISEAAIPGSPLIQRGRVPAELSGSIKTGLAIANPNPFPLTVSFFFTNSAGQDFDQGSLEIGPGGQIARFIDETPFGIAAPFEGTITFDASSPVGAVGIHGNINERSEFLTTALPVTNLQVASWDVAILPQFTDGAGWSTQIVLVNPTDELQKGQVEFWSSGDAAKPGQVAAVYEYVLPPRSSRSIKTAGIRGDLTSGWMQVVPQLNGVTPSVFEIFDYKSNDVIVSQSGFPAENSSSTFRLYVESSGEFGRPGSMQTGFAVANPGTEPVVVDVEWMSLSGEPTAHRTSVVVPAKGQIARYLSQLPDFADVPSSTGGVLRISTNSSSKINVIGLRARYNEAGDFLLTAMPTVTEGTIGLADTIMVPHFVDGGGFSTQFVLLNDAGSESSITLSHSSPDGQPMGETVRAKARE